VQRSKIVQPPAKTQPAPSPTTEIAGRLEQVRISAGYRTQKDFHSALKAAGADVSYSAVRNYHYDSREPPVSYLLRVADLVGVRFEWLATGRGPMEVVAETGNAAEQFKARRAQVMGEWIPDYDTLEEGLRNLHHLAFGAVVNSTPDGWQVLRMDADSLHGAAPFSGLDNVEWEAVGVLGGFIDDQLRRSTISQPRVPSEFWQWGRRYLLEAGVYVMKLPAPGEGRPMADVLASLGWLTPERRAEWTEWARKYLTTSPDDPDMPEGLRETWDTYGHQHTALRERDKRFAAFRASRNQASRSPAEQEA
jgi:hypothetical protein